jgi:hypothetical protein
LEADAASVTFSSLGSYEHLQVRISQRSTRTSDSSLFLQFNGDTGANYSNHEMHGISSTAAATSNTGYNQIYLWNGPGTDTVAAGYCTKIVDILDYRNANKNTTISCMNGEPPVTGVWFTSGLWDSTAAVTSLYFYMYSGSIARGTEITLYGLNSA